MVSSLVADYEVIGNGKNYKIDPAMQSNHCHLVIEILDC